MITVTEFCERFMDGMQPTPQQRMAIAHFLVGQDVATLWGGAVGNGKTTVANAMVRYLEDTGALRRPQVN